MNIIAPLIFSLSLAAQAAPPSDWPIPKPPAKYEALETLVREVWGETASVPSWMPKEKDFKKSAQRGLKAIAKARKQFPKDWESDPVYKDADTALATVLQQAEARPDWREKQRSLSEDLYNMLQAVKKINSPEPKEDDYRRVEEYWNSQPPVKPEWPEYFLHFIELASWPAYPRPFPRSSYWEKMRSGSSVDIAGLRKDAEEASARGRSWYDGQARELEARQKGQVRDAQLGGAGRSDVSALKGQQSRERADTLGQYQAAANFGAELHANYAASAARAEREHAEKKGDEVRYEMWQANFRHFEKALADVDSGALDGASMVQHLLGAVEFAGEGAPGFYSLDVKLEARNLKWLAGQARLRIRERKNTGRWFPVYQSYTGVRSGYARTGNGAKIAARVIKYDPRAAEGIAAAEKWQAGNCRQGALILECGKLPYFNDMVVIGDPRRR